MSSREMTAARQRDNSYRPDYAVPPHVLIETQFIESSEQVLSLESGYWVKSAVFDFRYYRVTVFKTDRSPIAATRDAEVGVVLLGAANVIGKCVVRRDVIKLRGRLIVLRRPGFPSID